MAWKKIWITIIVINILLSSRVCQTQFQNITESITKNKEKNATQNAEYITNFSYNSSILNSHIFFGDILANSLKDFVPFSDVNKKCTKDGQHFVKEFNNQTIWAVQMYESSSKYPGGILNGEVTEFGNFDQCMRVSSKKFGIYGAYAVANMQFRFADSEKSEVLDYVDADLEISNRDTLATGPSTMLWAVCVPDSCTEEDVKLSLERVLNSTFRVSNIVVDVTVPSLLYTSEKNMLEYTNGVLFAYVLIIGTIFLAIFGTLYGLYVDGSILPHNAISKKCFYSYSIINNIKNLVGNSKSDDFAIINGLKAIGLGQIMVFHRIVLDARAPSFNPEFYANLYNNFWLGFLKCQVPVEIFFVMSGFLTFILIENRLRSGKPFQFLFLLTYRIIRILPTYVTIIMVTAFILPYMGNGPIWKLVIYPDAQFCRQNWWTNLLFINNYVKSSEMCLFNTWYLACDMHFYIVGVLLTYTVYRWKKVGIYIFVIMFTLSVYIPAKFIYENKLWGFGPLFHSNWKDVRQSEQFNRVYIKSEFRITTYLIGMAAAYIYLRIKYIKFSVIGKTVGFLVSLFVMYFCMAITGYFYLPYVKYDPWDHVLYFTFQRIIYAIAVSYLIVVGSLSGFGFVSSFFQSKFCVVISRLSYIVYMVHLVVQMHSIGQLRQPLYENMWTLFLKINGDFATTFIWTLLVNIIVEAPSRTIFSHVFKLSLKEQNNSDPNDNENTDRMEISTV